jgi:Fe-S-cluster-containing hydrogenase component 2
MNLFIRIELAPTAQTIASLVALCPVNIFALCDGLVTVQDERQDECTLCELCLTAAPVGTIRIHKLYEGESQGT